MLEDTFYRACARVHAFYQLLRFTSPPQPNAAVLLQAPFVLAALLFPSRATLAGSAAANALTILAHLPAVVDMDHWALHTDVGLLALLASGADLGVISGTIRAQMATFYAAAGIWKATTDHSDPRLSCSSLLFVQTLCGWLPPALLSPTLVALIARSAPHVTLVVEVGIPVLLLAPVRRLHRLGVLLALALHVGITAAPLPLSISDFGAMSASRLVYIAPEGFARAVDEADAAAAAVLHGSVLGGVHAAVAAVIVASGVVCAVHGSGERVLAHTAFFALLALNARAVVLDHRSQAGQPHANQLKTAAAPAVRASGHAQQRLLTAAILGGAVFYAFGMPMLGLLDVGACTMFSHSACRNA